MPNTMQHPSIVYLNGQFISQDSAAISPDDRGFYFADGVYEVIKYYKGHPFCFAEHMNRLNSSLNAIRINLNNIQDLMGICAELIERNDLTNEYAGIYMQITRGVASRTHYFPGKEVLPTLYIRSFPMPNDLKGIRGGIYVISREDIRWQRCNIKTIALLANTLLFQEAYEQGAEECILIRNGNITEATHSNIMFVKNDIVYTHPDSNLILSGITKAVVIRICKKLGVKVIEEPIKIVSISDYSECFITSTGSEVMPVIKIDKTTVGEGVPGPVTRKLQEELFRITYWELAGEKIVMSDESIT
jgi:D-alanine transaminase